MAVGIGDETNPQHEPLREGFGKPHNLFLTRLSLFPTVNFLTFFDYGCPACYVSVSLAKKLAPYISEFSSTMAGIGGHGPRVTHDAIIKAQFYSATKLDSNWSTTITVSVGVTPDNIFPGDLTLGQTMFHALGLQCQNNGSIQLLGLPHKPTLHPVQSEKHTDHSFISTTISPISWHKLTPPKVLDMATITLADSLRYLIRIYEKSTKLSILAIV